MPNGSIVKSIQRGSVNKRITYPKGNSTWQTKNEIITINNINPSKSIILYSFEAIPTESYSDASVPGYGITLSNNNIAIPIYYWYNSARECEFDLVGWYEIIEFY